MRRIAAASRSLRSRLGNAVSGVAPVAERWSALAPRRAVPHLSIAPISIRIAFLACSRVPDPEYQKSLINSSLPFNRRYATAGPINIPKIASAGTPWSFSATNGPTNTVSPVPNCPPSTRLHVDIRPPLPRPPVRTNVDEATRRSRCRPIRYLYRYYR